MGLLKRFGYYFGGFSIGVIFLFFIWGGKETSCSYFPNSRVLKEISSKEQKISPKALSFFKKNNIDTTAVSDILKQGKVHFDESDKGRNVACRKYLISGNSQEQKLEIQVEMCEKTHKIATVLEAGFRKEK